MKVQEKEVNSQQMNWKKIRIKGQKYKLNYSANLDKPVKKKQNCLIGK